MATEYGVLLDVVMSVLSPFLSIIQYYYREITQYTVLNTLYWSTQSHPPLRLSLGLSFLLFGLRFKF